jgi:hypothetical protein
MTICNDMLLRFARRAAWRRCMLQGVMSLSPALIFDLDGTLVDTAPGVKHILRAWLGQPRPESHHGRA